MASAKPETSAPPTPEALEERLRGMELPKAPPGVKDRGLDAIMARVEQKQRQVA